MFSLISGLMHYLFKRSEYFILIVGLDNAGKTVGAHPDHMQIIRGGDHHNQAFVLSYPSAGPAPIAMTRLSRSDAPFAKLSFPEYLNPLLSSLVPSFCFRPLSRADSASSRSSRRPTNRLIRDCPRRRSPPLSG